MEDNYFKEALVFPKLTVSKGMMHRKNIAKGVMK